VRRPEPTKAGTKVDTERRVDALREPLRVGGAFDEAEASRSHWIAAPAMNTSLERVGGPPGGIAGDGRDETCSEGTARAPVVKRRIAAVP